MTDDHQYNKKAYFMDGLFVPGALEAMVSRVNDRWMILERYSIGKIFRCKDEIRKAFCEIRPSETDRNARPIVIDRPLAQGGTSFLFIATDTEIYDENKDYGNITPWVYAELMGIDHLLHPYVMRPNGMRVGSDGRLGAGLASIVLKVARLNQELDNDNAEEFLDRNPNCFRHEKEVSEDIDSPYVVTVTAAGECGGRQYATYSYPIANEALQTLESILTIQRHYGPAAKAAEHYTDEDMERIEGQYDLFCERLKRFDSKNSCEDPDIWHIGEMPKESPFCYKQLAPDLIRTMLKGVQAVHKAGFLHRDIKPENFLAHCGYTPDYWQVLHYDARQPGFIPVDTKSDFYYRYDDTELREALIDRSLQVGPRGLLTEKQDMHIGGDPLGLHCIYGGNYIHLALGDLQTCLRPKDGDSEFWGFTRGSRHHCAPEMLRNSIAGRADEPMTFASDIFNVGCCILRILDPRISSHNDEFDWLAALNAAELDVSGFPSAAHMLPMMETRLDRDKLRIWMDDLMRELDPAWQAIVTKCTAFDKDDRYQSVDDIIKDVNAVSPPFDRKKFELRQLPPNMPWRPAHIYQQQRMMGSIRGLQWMD